MIASVWQPLLRHFCWLATIFWTVLWAVGAYAQASCPSAIVLSDDTSLSFDLGPLACVFVDETRSETLESMLDLEQVDLFTPVPTGLIDFGFGAARYWVRVGLANGTKNTETWWITHDLPIPDRMRVHLLVAGKPPEKLLDLTDDDPFGARPIPHRHLASSVTLGPGETGILLIDYVTSQSTQMPLFVETVSGFINRTQSETAMHVALIAVILGMGIISTVYFFSLEGSGALVYGAYVIATVAMLAQMEGYLFQYVYPGATRFNAVGFTVFGCMSVGLGLLFVDRLTSTQRFNPILHMVVLVAVAALAILIGLVHFFIATAWFKFAILLTTAFGTVVQVAVIAAALLRRHPGAWLLLVAFVAVSAGVILVGVGYATEGLFPQEMAGSALRSGYLLEAAAFSGAIALRVREARIRRDRSLSEQLRLSQEKLTLSEALRRADQEREDAERAAQHSREALANAAHDIRQPLASIQMALAVEDTNTQNIAGSLNYIEEIVKGGLEAGSTQTNSADTDPPQVGTKEKIAASLVLQNIKMMFAEDARSKNIALTVVMSDEILSTDPLALMRALSNLVSNALTHANAERILVGCRRDGASLRFEVHDNGCGMDAEALQILTLRGNKASNSAGHGLGTAIVAEIADANGFDFAMKSYPGKGTIASLKVAVSADPVDQRNVA